MLLFLLPVLSNIRPQYYCSCCLSYQIKHQNIFFYCSSCHIYHHKMLFLLSLLSDIPPKYYCFSGLSYQIYPHNITVFLAFPTRYTPTILLFLFPVVSDITPQYYCFCCHLYQIYLVLPFITDMPQNFTASVAFPIRYTTTIFLFLLPFLSDITPQYCCFCCTSY